MNQDVLKQIVEHKLAEQEALQAIRKAAASAVPVLRDSGRNHSADSLQLVLDKYDGVMQSAKSLITDLVKRPGNVDYDVSCGCESCERLDAESKAKDPAAWEQRQKELADGWRLIQSGGLHGFDEKSLRVMERWAARQKPAEPHAPRVEDCGCPDCRGAAILKAELAASEERQRVEAERELRGFSRGAQS